MFRAYRELFSAPGTRWLLLAGLLARLPLPMTGIGIITLLAQLRGSYTLAGAVSATFVLGYALLSPQVARLADRHSQHRVLPVASAISLAGMLLLAATTCLQAPDGLLFVGALLAGFMPGMSAMVRARWAALYRGQPRLQSANSLETVLDEVTFIAGPPLSVGLAVAAFPQAGLLAAALLLAGGTLALVRLRATEPLTSSEPTAAVRGGSPIGQPGVRLLALLMMAMGIIVGSVDVVSVAFAELSGQPAAASLVLSAYAFGSCSAGLLFGALRLTTPLHRQLLVGGLAVALTTLPLWLAGSITTLTGAVLLAGVSFAPTMIIAMSLVERLVAVEKLTEGMSWLLAGLNIGVALGAAVSGRLVDSFGLQAGFSVAIGAGAAIVLLAIAGSYWLDGTQRHRTERNA